MFHDPSRNGGTTAVTPLRQFHIILQITPR
jgi:hypothetical protein